MRWWRQKKIETEKKTYKVREEEEEEKEEEEKVTKKYLIAFVWLLLAIIIHFFLSLFKVLQHRHYHRSVEHTHQKFRNMDQTWFYNSI